MPMYTNFEGECAPKKRDAPRQNCAKKLGQNGVFILIWESSENQFGRPITKVDKIYNFFFVNPPSRKS